MRKRALSFVVMLGVVWFGVGQQNQAKKLLDEVSVTMESYQNMTISFETSLTNEEAGIKEGDEPPMKGTIVLEGEKYNLDYLGNSFIFDGEKLYVINHDEQEITINEGDLEAEDGFIYPSKLYTFYKEGYTFSMGTTATVNGKKIQSVQLLPIDSDADIVKVELGIEIATKHIVSLTQTGANSSKTKIRITSFAKNSTIEKNTFEFDEAAYLKKNYIID